MNLKLREKMNELGLTEEDLIEVLEMIKVAKNKNINIINIIESFKASGNKCDSCGRPF